MTPRAVDPVAGVAGEESAAGRRLRAGVLCSFAGSMGRRCGAFLVAILLARWLGREGLGAYALLVSLCILAAVPQTAVGTALAKLVAEADRLGEGRRLGRLVGAGLALGGAALLAAAAACLALRGVLAERVYEEPLLENLMPLGALYLVSIGSMDLLASVLQGLQAFRLMKNLALAFSALAPAAAVALVPWLGIGGAVLASCAAGGAVAAASAAALSALGSRRGARLLAAPDAQSLRAVLGYSVPTLLSGFVGPLAMGIGSALLVRSEGFSSLGLFNAANSLASNIPFIAAAVGTALIPMISGASAAREEEAAAVASQGFRLVVLASLPAAVALTAYSRPLLALLYGRGFDAAAPLLGLLAAANLLAGAAYVLGSIFAGKGAVWRALGVNLLWMAAFLLAALAMRSRGASGFAAALLIAYALHSGLLLALCRGFWRIAMEGFAPLAALAAAGLGGAAALSSFADAGLLQAAAPALIAGALAAEWALLTDGERMALADLWRRSPLRAARQGG